MLNTNQSYTKSLHTLHTATLEFVECA